MLQYRLLGLHSIEKGRSQVFFFYSHQSYILHGYLWTYEGKIIVVNKKHPPPPKKENRQNKNKNKIGKQRKKKTHPLRNVPP